MSKPSRSEDSGRRIMATMRLPRVADMTFGDLGRGAVRLSPFLGAAGAALLMVVFPPGGASRSVTAAGAGHHYTIPTPAGLDDSPAVAAPPTTVAAPSVDLSASMPTAASVLGTQLPGPVSTVSSSGGLTNASDAVAANGVSGGPGPETSTDAPASTPGPLTIATKGWASREAGTPADTAGVPDGTLPVGNRVGQLDKASYIKLRGSETTLHLVEDTDGARNLAGAGVVQACKITATWTAADAMSFDQAPAYDSSACVAGTPAADNVWTFDLSSFGNPTQGNGFALVPAPSAPVDFQVTFKAG